MKQLEAVELYGTIRGQIWMPAVECTKEFELCLSPIHSAFRRDWNGLRDAFVHLTNDGDFQSCNISEIGGKAIYRLENGDQLVKYLKINPVAKEFADCFTEDAYCF